MTTWNKTEDKLVVRELRGSELHPADKHYVLSAYVHRFTGDHTPNWAQTPMPNGEKYPVQFASDADWLHNTWFRVKRNGRLDGRVSICRSVPTWPKKSA